MILTASSFVGIHAALRLRKTEEQLRSLHKALEQIGGEIQFAGTPFGPLCERIARTAGGSVGVYFSALSRQTAGAGLHSQGMTRCAAAEAGLVLPEPALLSLERLFDSFGRSDLDSQLRQLQLASTELGRLSEELRQQMTGKCRSYELLGLTTGAAVLVLVL